MMDGDRAAVMLYAPAAPSRRTHSRSVVAKPNYSYEKRQRELAKKRKQEDKRQKKSNPRPDGEPDAQEPGNDTAQGGPQPATPDSGN